MCAVGDMDNAVSLLCVKMANVTTRRSLLIIYIGTRIGLLLRVERSYSQAYVCVCHNMCILKYVHRFMFMLVYM